MKLNNAVIKINRLIFIINSTQDEAKNEAIKLLLEILRDEYKLDNIDMLMFSDVIYSQSGNIIKISDLHEVFHKKYIKDMAFDLMGGSIEYTEENCNKFLANINQLIEIQQDLDSKQIEELKQKGDKNYKNRQLIWSAYKQGK